MSATSSIGVSERRRGRPLGSVMASCVTRSPRFVSAPDVGYGDAMRILLAILPSFAATVLPAQTATVSFYGAGCSFVGQSLAIGVQGLPQLGTTITFTYTGPNQNGPLTVQPVLGLGLAATSVPIPASLLFQQPNGCTQ